MEAAFYYLTIAAILIAGLMIGRRARSTIHATALGVAVNMAGAVALFCSIVLIAVLAPGSLDARSMGFRLGALLLFGSALGVVAAMAGRRYALKGAARLF
jgi:hypothetical protein